MKLDGSGGDGGGADGGGTEGGGGGGPGRGAAAAGLEDGRGGGPPAPEDAHWTRQQLWSMVGDPARAREVVDDALAHLAALCPRCGEELAAHLAELQRDEEAAASDYGQAIARAVARLPEAAAAAAEDRETAAAALAALAALPAAAQRQAVEAEPERYRGAALADALLEEARARLPGEPRRARALLRLARQVLDQTPSSPATVELYVRVLAHLGNVHRLLEELEAAGRLLTLARDLAESHGPPPPALEAEVNQLEATLFRDQRRLPEAVRLLHRAVATYQELEQGQEAARALLKLGLTHREAGELEEAAAVTRQALTLLGPGAETRLVRMARHNLALFLNDGGRHREARFALLQAEGMAWDDAPPVTRLRFLWLEGRIAAGLGEDEAAAGAYRAVQAGFVKEELPYDAALVSLDLAALLQRQGRHAAVQELAEEMVTIFGGKGIHREAAAALLLFVDAARRRAVSGGFLARLTAYLEEARHNPALAFQPPGA